MPDTPRPASKMTIFGACDAYCKVNIIRTATRLSTATPFSTTGSKRHWLMALVAESSNTEPGVDSMISMLWTLPSRETVKLTSTQPLVFLRSADRGYLGAT